MKNVTAFRVASSKAKIISLAIIFLIGLSGFNNNDKITICHMPPGNVDNCHEITISRSALQTHLDHGDRLFCNSEADLADYLKLVDNNQSLLIIQY